MGSSVSILLKACTIAGFLFALTAFSILANTVKAQDVLSVRELSRTYKIAEPQVVLALPEPLPRLNINGLNMACRTYCSQFRLRTGVAEVTWKPQTNTIPTKQVLQTTIHFNGFETGNYLSFGLDERRYNPTDTKRTPLRPQISNEDLFSLRSSHIALTAFARDGELLGHPDRGKRDVAVFENLEPGLIYRVRVLDQVDGGWKSGDTVWCEAPVCPADMKEGK